MDWLRQIHGVHKLVIGPHTRVPHGWLMLSLEN
jgi:hypothetical protein